MSIARQPEEATSLKQEATHRPKTVIVNYQSGLLHLIAILPIDPS